ncbi:uncharacterized protein AC631_05178 [Debaryomyces fabryi]|uniref:Zn(2)-C6 fungal-type domain-containing protein n=1 Tax=Debaryomyces fabryi TaxID=58627 RepID=A0A0V1PS26_9ASCO|nr:uncharacterized protein AC631_05178 [Debaryomyces fabryi]KRZ99052.1 hypothetical protein AC631_05178 [Debaryomyces fabryi]CUM45383.1 unnamed protein product [Debaryomyces fabryi]
MEIVTIDSFNCKSGHQKKRRRPVKLCLACRMRKSKCDLKRPTCTSCLVKGLKNCKYGESSTYSVKLGDDEVDVLKEENERLKLTIKQLKRQISSPSPSPISEYANGAEADKYNFIVSKSSRTVFYGPTSFRFVFQTPIVFDYYISIKRALKADRNAWKIKNRPKSWFDKLYSGTSELLMDIQNFLPSHKVVSGYLLQFFDGFWFKLLPIVDRDVILQVFRKQFKESDNKLNIEIAFPQNSIEFANIAVVITILKFSLNSETYLPGAVSYRFKDEYDILLKFATRLLDNANYLEKASLSSLQALFLLRIFKKFNFKDGDGGDGSNGNILFAICLEMAYTLGLNQNIDMLYKEESQNYRTILKNLWKYLLQYDAINSFDLGVPLHISDSCLREEFLDSDDIIIKTILKKREIINIFLSPKFTYHDIGNILNEIRCFIDQNFRTVFELIQDFEDASNLEDSYNAINQFILSISLIAMKQHCYSLLYNELKDTNKELSSRSHDLGIKYTTLMIVSSAELFKRTHISSMELSSTPISNQIHNFIAGMTTQCMVRAFVFYVFLLLSFVKLLKDLAFKNIMDNHITLRLSELADPDNEVDGIVEEEFSDNTALVSLNVIISRYMNMLIYLETNGNEREKLATKVQNYSLFIVNTSLNHFKLLIAQDDDFKSLMSFDQNNLHIVYDSMQESFPTHVYVAENVSSIPTLDIFSENGLNASADAINLDIYDFLLI